MTTVIGGNCGFTIAPLGDDPAHGDYLMRMLARVEGIPLEALQQGVPWSWQTTAEYLDAIDGNVAVNAGFKVGHSALRRVVMGDDSVRRACTGDELEAMKTLLRDGLEAGALGFSSSWSRTHNDPMGNMVPSRYGERDELVELCSVLADFDGTSVEFIPAFGPFEDWALELMSDMSVAARSPLNWNVMTVTARSMETNPCEAGRRGPRRGPRGQGGGSDRAADAVAAPQLQQRLRARRPARLGGGDAAAQGGQAPRPRRPGRASPPERAGAGGPSTAGAGPLGAQGCVPLPGARERGLCGPHGGRDRGPSVARIPGTRYATSPSTDDLETSFGNPAVSEPDADWEARVESLARSEVR